MPSHNYFTSSIGKKQITGLTGLGLLGFTATHLAGNLLILAGPDTFNAYSNELITHPLILFAEAGLATLFVVHIVTALVLTAQNVQARGKRYYIKTRSGRGETIASMTMPYTGLILLIFVILHLINFKFGTEYPTVVDGVQMRDIFRTVVEYFQNPLYVVWYVLAMCALGLHTGHGFQSSFQTWGLSHPKYNPILRFASIAYGTVVAVGFSGLAIYCHFLNL